MRLAGKTQYGGEATLLYTWVEMDLFQDRRNKLVLHSGLFHEETLGGSNYTAVFELKCQGLGLNVDVLGHVGWTCNTTTAGLALDYLSRTSHKYKFINLMIFEQGHMHILLIGPTHKVEGKTTVRLTEDHLGYSSCEVTSVVQLPGLPLSEIHSTLSHFPELEVRIFKTASPENYYQQFVGLRNERTFEVSLKKRTNYNTDDVYGAVTYLNNTQLLYTSIRWNADGMKELWEATRSIVDRVGEEAELVIVNLVGEAAEELTAALTRTGTVLPDVETIVQYYISEWDALGVRISQSSSIRRAGEALWDGLRIRSWKMPDVAAALGTAGDSGISKMFIQYVVFGQTVIDLAYETLTDVTLRILEYLQLKLTGFFITIGIIIEEIVTVDIPEVFSSILNIVTYSYQCVLLMFSEAENTYSGLNLLINKYFESLQEFLLYWREYTESALQSFYDAMWNSILSSGPIHEIRTQYNYYREEYSEFIEDFSRKVGEYISSRQEMVRKTLNLLLAGQSDDTNKMVNSFLDYLENRFKYIYHEETDTEEYKEYLIELSDLAFNMVNSYIPDVWIFEPEKRNIQFLVPLPYAVHALRDIGTRETSGSHVRASRFEPGFSVWDIYYRYKPSSNVANWLPPFNTYAMLIASQEYMTFDKVFYSFTGHCQYLLTHALVNDSFSIAVDYSKSEERRPYKSIIFAEGNDIIEVYSNYQVTLNKKPVNLPVHITDMKVKRQWNHITVESQKGVTLAWNIPEDVCIVYMNGFYYGKTVGLFGTYNNQQYDEFLKPNGQIAKNIAAFTRSWKLNKRCTQEVEIQQAEQITPKYRECHQMLLDSSSTLRPCYKQISPRPFFDMCVNLTGSIPEPLLAETLGCQAAAAYAAACRAVEVDVHTPPICDTVFYL